MTDEPEVKDDDWDPPPAERTYYSHRETGDYGWLVRRGGKDMVRMDRPGVEDIRPFKEGRDWTAKIDVRPLSPAQVALIAFQADRQLCLALGMHENIKEEWLSLSQEKRRIWIEKGPTKNPLRKSLYQAIMGVVGHLTHR